MPCFFLAFVACTENNKPASGEIDLKGAIETAESRRTTDPDASGGNNCLLGYQTKYDQLLSEAEVIAATGFSKNLMETKSNTVLKNPAYHSFEYRFGNGRERIVAGINQKLAMPDVISVSGIRAISASSFEATYKAITDEEMQRTKEVLKKAAAGNSGNAEADKAMEKAKEKNSSKEQVTKTGGELLDQIKAVSKGYRVVEGLGDAARWNLVSNELIVLQNGVQFQLRSDISADQAKNKAVAIELANRILNKCK